MTAKKQHDNFYHTMSGVSAASFDMLVEFPGGVLDYGEFCSHLAVPSLTASLRNPLGYGPLTKSFSLDRA